jgi:predicted MarR family transcription regulator
MIANLTEIENLALEALTPQRRHSDVCLAVGATTGWNASRPIKKLIEEGLVTRVKRGHYVRSDETTKD